jgi:tape measure domain-containing protein
VSVVANVAINVDSSGAVSKLRQVQQGAQATSQAVDKLNATNNALAASFTKSGKPIQTAANGMRFFTDATGRARKVNGQFVTTAEAAAAGLQKQGRAAQQAGASVSNFGGTVRALLGSFALIRSARFVFAKTAEVQSQSRSLAILAGSAEKAGQIIKELQDLGAVTPFTSTELIDSAKRLQAFGVEADKVVETTRRLADASGATGAELSGLVTAYGQVQAKGRLQGEELLQFQERGIALQEELRKMYGMTGEEFQKALSKGQVSAKAVEVALQNLTNTGGKYANGAIAQSDTLNGRLSTLQDNVDGVAREVGKVLTPALIEILQQLNTSLSQTPAFVEDIALAFQYAAEQLAPFLNGLSQMQWFFTNLTPPGWAMQVIGGAAERGKSTIRGAASRQRQSRENSFIGPAAPQMQGPAIPERLRQKPNNLPPPLMIPSATGTGAKKGKTDAERAAEKKRRAAEELANLQGQVTLKEKLFGIDKQIAVEKQRGSLVTAAALEMDKALEERQTRIAEITRSTADTATKNAQIKDATLDADQKIYAVQQAIKEQEAERIKSFDAIIADLNLELALKTATTEQAREQLRLEAEIAKIRGDKSLTDPQKDEIERRKRELAAPKTDRERLEGAAAGVKAELDTLTDPINMITTAAAGIGDAFSTSFKGIISGSMTAKEALASFFTSVADMFLDMAAQIIAKMIQMAILNAIVSLLPGSSGGGLGSSQFKPGAPAQMVPSLPNVPDYSGAFKPRANGGPVSSGQTYMVGERGPELFVPGRSGTIVANDKMGGGSTNVVVNVDAKGSSVEGNEQGANQLGRVISAAVQSELIKQQRPGGILAR